MTNAAAKVTSTQPLELNKPTTKIFMELYYSDSLKDEFIRSEQKEKLVESKKQEEVVKKNPRFTKFKSIVISLRTSLEHNYSTFCESTK